VSIPYNPLAIAGHHTIRYRVRDSQRGKSRARGRSACGVSRDPVARPQTLDVLLYLDDTDDLNGPLCVAPGSHNWIDRDLPASDFDPKPDEVVLRLSAGSLVMCHGSLWRLALPTKPGGGHRRLLLFGYGPAWMKPAIYGEKPANGLTTRLLQDPDVDQETRELLGTAGYM